MPLTRPQRRTMIATSLAVGFGIIACVLWLPSEHAWTATPTAPAGPTLGIESRQFGLLVYLTWERTDVPVGGPPAPTSIASTHWYPLRLAGTIALTLVTAGLTILFARKLIPHGADPRYCDECGYLLRGLPTARCPECGADAPVSPPGAPSADP